MGAAISSPYYLTDGQFFMNGSNIVTGDWTNLSTAFVNPVATHATPITGYDWTKPFPGSALSGHTVNLTIAHEMHISADVVEDSTTVLSSLTFGTPASIMADSSQPKAMDQSWYVCRHVFISTDPAVKQKVDGGAGTSLLPAACQTDLKTSLTQDWGTLDATYMCGALGFDSIPASCVDSFGFSRQDVMCMCLLLSLLTHILILSTAFDSTFLANTTIASAQVSSLQKPYSWRIGTQYHEPGSAKAYEMAANRTYLVATVWGYSSTASSSIRKTPEVSFGILSSGAAYVPPPPVPNTTTSASSTSTASSTVSKSTASTTSSSKPTTTTPAALPTSTDGKCGANGATCKGSTFGNCCSVKGNCGSTLAFCGVSNLCQPGFGTCTPVSTDGKCGSASSTGAMCLGSTFGNCCSVKGNCGSTPAFCGTTNLCQPGFGTCTPVSTDGKCGSASTVGAMCLGSSFGDCCSVKGNCGTTAAFCSTANLCQPSFGTCTA